MISSAFREDGTLKAPRRLPDRSPPHDLDEESHVISSVLEIPSKVLEAAHLEPAHFFDRRMGKLWGALKALTTDMEYVPTPVEILSHIQAAEGEEWWSRGGADLRLLLTNIIANVPVTVRVAEAADRIVELAARRAAISAAYEILSDAYDGTDENRAFIGRCQEKFNVISDMLETGHTDTCAQIGDIVRSELMDMASGRREIVIPTGFDDLNGLLDGGHRCGELVIVGARPGAGKSAYAMRTAMETAQLSHCTEVDESPGVLVFSAEMKRARVALRVLSAESNVKARVFRTSFSPDVIGPDAFQRIVDTQNNLTTLPLWIDDRSAPSLAYLRARMAKAKLDAARWPSSNGKKTRIRLVVADYLQLFDTLKMKGKNRENEVAELSKGLKSFAKDEDVVMIALSQLNRGVEERGNKRPIMSDLRESGAIEQDADVILLLYRDEYYYEHTQARGIAEILIAKHREGQTGRSLVGFDKEYTRFRNLSEQEQERAQENVDAAIRAAGGKGR